MVKVGDLIDHVATEYGVGDTAAYPFKVGYMTSMLEELQLRYPEVREYLESRARTHKFEGVK